MEGVARQVTAVPVYIKESDYMIFGLIQISLLVATEAEYCL